MATLIRLSDQDNVAVAARSLDRGAVVAVDGEELFVRVGDRSSDGDPADPQGRPRV